MEKIKDKICVHAWKSFYVTPLGEAGMCCIQWPLLSKIDSKTDVKNVRKEKIWDSIRESMLKGEEHPSCKTCWNQEKENNLISFRKRMNESYPEEYNIIKEKNSKTLIDENLVFVDIRQSNVCNMKCLSCSPVFSSSWGAEPGTKHQLYYTTGGPYEGIINKNGVVRVENNNFEDYILSNMSSVKEVYFAGGEPMLNSIHWTILKELDRLGRHDIRIYYNTNLLKLDYKGVHVFEYWDKFTEWFAGCSIDAIGLRGEYVRTGTKWSIIDKNIKLMQDRYPWQFNIDSTVSALSVGGLEDLMIYCENLNIKQHRWGNTVVRPEHLRLDILPRDYRKHIVNSIEKIVKRKIKNATEEGVTGPNTLKSFLKHFKIAMLDSDASNKAKYFFKSFIEEKDKIRNTDIFKSCPEFKELWPKI